MNKRNAERALHYHRTGHYTRAVDAYTAALKDTPGHPFLIGNRAENLQLLGRFDEAIADFQIALRDMPNEEAFWVNYGLALQSAGHFEAAMAAFDHAIVVGPSNPFAWFNKGVLLERDLGRHGEGVACFKKALEFEPGFNHAVGGMSFYHLKHGNFAEGWRDFEYRNLSGPPTKLPGLLWNGAQTDDTLILVAEQGIGDIVQFARYAKIAAHNGQKTAIYAPEEFHALLRSLHPDIALMSTPAEVEEPYQWLPIMSMAKMMGTTVETIPQMPGGYLSSTPDRIEKWGTWLRGMNATFKIGIVWQPGHQWLPHAFGRIIPLEMFKGLSEIPGVQLISLQKDGPAAQIKDVDFSVIEVPDVDPIPRKDLFMDTAAIMQNLDLVISTDTGPLHVAGAVGARTFAAIPKGSCWRWLIDREDTPWYPNMRLYRQKSVYDWAEVFARITADVAEMVARKS